MDALLDDSLCVNRFDFCGSLNGSVFIAILPIQSKWMYPEIQPMSSYDKSTELFFLWSEMITLGQLIKALGLVESGAHVRDVLSSGEVLVNDEVEIRRGRKLYPGDIISPTKGRFVKLVAEASQ